VFIFPQCVGSIPVFGLTVELFKSFPSPITGLGESPEGDKKEGSRERLGIR